jgi:Cytochrome oxidase complex assembly protein 1
MDATTPPVLTPLPPSPQPRRSRPWLVLGGILGAGLLLTGLVAGLVLGVMSLMKSSDVYRDALNQTRQNPAVIAALGSPLRAGWFVTGNISFINDSGAANLAIPVSGPKGRGTIHVIGERANRRWTLKRLDVEIKNTGQRINLIDAQKPKLIVYFPALPPSGMAVCL